MKLRSLDVHVRRNHIVRLANSLGSTTTETQIIVRLASSLGSTTTETQEQHDRLDPHEASTSTISLGRHAKPAQIHFMMLTVDARWAKPPVSASRRP
eukprot:6922945-Heterocapsa_arctica.AAC.1